MLITRTSSPLFWSSCLLRAGDSSIITWWCLFAASVGCIGQGYDRALTLADTNLMQSCRLPGTFSCTGVSWVISGGLAADRSAVATMGSWAWEFGSCTQLPGAPLWTWDAPAGLTPREATRLARSMRQRVPGVVCGQRLYASMPYVVPLGHLFCLRLEVPYAPRKYGVTVKFALHGKLVETLEVA